MLGTIIDICSLVIIVVVVLMAVWVLVKKIWPGVEATTAGQLIGKVSDTTQAYTMYIWLEGMKRDNKIAPNAEALKAIALLQKAVLQGVADDWAASVAEVEVK